MARISLGTDPFSNGERRLTRGGADNGQMAKRGGEVKEKRVFGGRYHVTAQ
jgi:hypothetical protein